MRREEEHAQGRLKWHRVLLFFWEENEINLGITKK
jgi:hypothetical protein